LIRSTLSASKQLAKRLSWPRIDVGIEKEFSIVIRIEGGAQRHGHLLENCLLAGRQRI
jgi:hypothetical protein